jgi:hypothetical protein
MPFETGQPFIINDVIANRHSGERAIVVEYRPSRREVRTLDKYVVQVGDGERIELWAIQLESEKN